MKARASIKGHPLHPALVGIPLAMFPVIALFDVLWYATDNEGFWTAGWWLALVGLATALLAAVPGFLDFTKLPDHTSARRTGRWHMLLGITLIALFAVVLSVRLPVGSGPGGQAWAVVLDAAGLVATGVQGFLGGRLVYHHHAGVPEADEGAEPLRA